MRIVNMEAIIKGGDQLKTDVALRTALSSNDAQLRGLGLRAFTAHTKTVNLEIKLPAEALAEVDRAEHEGRLNATVRDQFDYVIRTRQVGGKIHIAVRSYTFPDDRGLLDGSRPEPSTIAGDHTPRSCAFLPVTPVRWISRPPVNSPSKADWPAITAAETAAERSDLLIPVTWTIE